VAHEQRKAKAPTITVREAAREVAGLGGPTALHFGFEVLAFTTFTAILGSFGAAQMAAHQITMNTIRVSFLPGVAVAEAASVLVARALAKRRLDEADQVTRASLTLGIGFMSVCGVLFALFGASVAHAFSDDPQVVSVARQLFFAAAIFQTLDAVNIILRGALRGAKDVRWVAVVGTTIVWVTIPGAAFVLGRLLGWGAFGGWVGFIFETSLGAWMMWRRWSRGPWRRDFGAEPERSPGPGLAHAGVSAVLKRRGARASPRARARP
jgi:MATE family multidrug resistance protein